MGLPGHHPRLKTSPDEERGLARLRCTGTARAREAEDESRAEIGPWDGPTQGHLHILEDCAGALGSRSEDG